MFFLLIVLGNRITTRSCANDKCNDSMVTALVDGVCRTCETDLCNGSSNSVFGNFNYFYQCFNFKILLDFLKWLYRRKLQTDARKT